MVCSARFVFRLLAVLLTALVATTVPVWAQDPPEITLPLPEKVDYVAMTPPLGIPTEEPYIHWTKHLGKMEEGIARIEARFPDGNIRESTGLSIRCDGLILAPVWVREAMKEGAIVTVAPAEAENETLTAPLPVAGRFYHNIPRVEYTIIKVNDHHLPCVPLLESRNVAPGVRVRIYRAVSDGAGRCKAAWVAATIGSEVENPEVGRHDRFALTPTEGGILDDKTAPAGAIVVDEQSGSGLGIVLESGKGGAVFTTFIYFYDFTGEVGLMVDRAAVKDREGQPQNMTLAQINALKPGKPARGWCWIPGGPIRLTGPTLDHYRRNFRTETVCLPGFFIGSYPITRRQYYEWQDSVGANERPRDGAVDKGARDAYPNCPIGVERAETAMRYASAQLTRLPTESEWRRASLRHDYQWAYRRLEVWDATLRRMISFFNHSVQAAESLNDPSSPQDQQQIKAMQDQFPNELPWHFCPVELRAGEDVSLFGVTNVMMNSDEYLLATPALPSITPQPFPARIDPLLSIMYFEIVWNVDNQKNRGGKTVSQQSASGNLSYHEHQASSPGTGVQVVLYDVGAIIVRTPVRGNLNLTWNDIVDLPAGEGVNVHTFRILVRWEPKINPGFRLAR